METILSVLNGLNFDPVVFCCQLALFYILHSVLKVVLYAPMEKVRDERESLTSGRVDQAEMLNSRALELKNKYEAQIRDARKEGLEIVNAARQQCEAERLTRLEEARAESERVISAAHAEVEKERVQAEKELQSKVPELAEAIALKLLNSTLDRTHREQAVRRLKEVCQ